MKHKIALILFGILAVVVIGDGLVKSKRAEQRSSQLTRTVEALSPQELAARVAECDAASRQVQRREDAAFCAEVSRRLDNQPLQIVEPTKRP